MKPCFDQCWRAYDHHWLPLLQQKLPKSKESYLRSLCLNCIVFMSAESDRAVERNVYVWIRFVVSPEIFSWMILKKSFPCLLCFNHFLELSLGKAYNIKLFWYIYKCRHSSKSIEHLPRGRLILSVQTVIVYDRHPKTIQSY